jgi:hypothetical protein
MSNQLVYFELHVDDETFYVHGVVNAKDKKHALDNLSSLNGKHYHLQLKGALGKATEKNMIKYLKDSIPKYAYNSTAKK